MDHIQLKMDVVLSKRDVNGCTSAGMLRLVQGLLGALPFPLSVCVTRWIVAP